MQSSDFNAPRYWSEGCFYLAQRDPVLAQLIEQFPNGKLQSRGCAFTTLLRSIIGQQISVKAADAVWVRFLTTCGETLTPEAVLDASTDHLRLAGLSGQKVKYVKNIATHFRDRPPERPSFQDQNPEDTYTELITIKGIGPWTIDMFLMFHVLHLDIFPLGDIGLINALRQFYPELKEADKSALTVHGENWRPYRSIATWYLWRALDPIEVAY